MNIEKLDETLEALLFVSGDGMKISDIQQALELQKTEVNAAVNRLKEKYSGTSGIHLLVYNNKLQFASNPDYASVVEDILNPVREKALSAAVLETAAIVAYRQPVTRLEIEQIRGVNCDYAMAVLLKNELIEAVGHKDAVGKPLMFGTTDNFLKRFRIESISQLPDYENLLESIKTLNVQGQESKSLFNFSTNEANNDTDGQADIVIKHTTSGIEDQ